MALTAPFPLLAIVSSPATPPLLLSVNVICARPLNTKTSSNDFMQVENQILISYSLTGLSNLCEWQGVWHDVWENGAVVGV